MSRPSRDPMTDDELMRALAREARELREEEGFATLEGWARGELDEATARRGAPVADAPAARELFAPWDDAARDALAEKMLALARPGDRAALAMSAAASAHPARTRRPGALAAASGLALAAAVILLLSVREPSLPAYRSEISAGDQALRSESAPEPGPARVREDSTLELRMWPETAVDARISSVLLVRGARDPRFVLVRARAEIAASGAVRWRGAARDLVLGRRGDLTLRAVVGRAGALPPLEEIVKLGPGGHGAWSSVEVSLAVYAK